MNEQDSMFEDNREALDASSADTDIWTPTTHDGQPIVIDERLYGWSTYGRGTKRDSLCYSHQPSFPSCLTARTTLYADDKDVEGIDVEKYEILFLLQHSRQHPAEPHIKGYSEGWDGQKVRQENVWKYARAHTILSQTEVTGAVQKWTLQRVMSENLNGFSRYYEGIDGAAIGFATLYKYSDSDQAKDSYLVDEAERLLDIDGEKLVDYVWRKYGGDLQ